MLAPFCFDRSSSGPLELELLSSTVQDVSPSPAAFLTLSSLLPPLSAFFTFARTSLTTFLISLAACLTASRMGL